MSGTATWFAMRSIYVALTNKSESGVSRGGAIMVFDSCVVFVPRPWTFCVRCSLQKQAKGKKRMKMMGSVNVPQEAFMAVLNLKDGS